MKVDARMLAAAVFAAAGLAGLAYVAGWFASPTAEQQVFVRDYEDVVDRKTIQRAGSKDLDSLQPVAEALRAKGSASSTARLPQRDALAEAAAAVFLAWVEPSFEPYRDLLVGQGVTPIPRWESNPEAAQRLWNDARALLVLAEYEVADIEIRDVGRAGRYDEVAGFSSLRSGRRDVARPFLAEIPEERRIVAEAVLPGEYQAQSGDRFDGAIALEFTFNPRAQQWVLTGVRLMGVPSGVSAHTPPL